ncbi:Oidioi.mRNA.OKI2018_I69.PAR.g8674.t1.cds [Oikopleura dioica]|uniref:Oidioi.mRNA.OKI2018_I69.PAR.g8674.t1.cds n=1 Tax=Oikopleura dioica TaxID=34765 RepID=A0ABN7RL46_OIKDI|nr:Oidioi.mRNA.OKI2018_I69.PAR.g8674.t1.cds [Oikopleura dioica]
MRFFDISLMSSTRWRQSHAMSHHTFPNTCLDLEVTQFEPFAYLMPKPTSLFYNIFSLFILPILLTAVTFIDFLKRWISNLLFTEDEFELVDLIPFLELYGFYLVNKESYLWFFFVFHGTLSFTFAFLSLPGIHHHSSNFYEGHQGRKDTDWGLLQVDTIVDRWLTSSDNTSHSIAVSAFGDHTLHHLFPTVDGSILQHFIPAYRITLAEFNINYKQSNCFYDWFEFTKVLFTTKQKKKQK